ncbi:hypothetical protein BTM25_06350 [Actinomadura rubteroloni]|uniref:Uncharacterized protein n=1 Tax=Actinomadura rubteroloni TaxID=1926885 RepID=A0A2P4UMG5_9ACTN|nr:hypothetical protein [Actinomadura rubteroloni]POM26241.1 hypothetical protein BTM25_06350 [Actinomadura rubteroloni]
MDDDLLVAVEILAAIHDRTDVGQSDPPPDGGGDDPWPEGDSLNLPG